MEKIFKILLIGIIVLVFGGGSLVTVFFQPSPSQPSQRSQNFSQQDIPQGLMEIKSPVFSDYQPIPSRYTCDGQNINPPLEIRDVPEGSRSLVLIVHDPDAPTKDWVHWTLWNIDPKTNFIEEDNVPAGAVEGMTDFGKVGYGGPCPPSGEHRYFFELYALDTSLDLDGSATREEIEKAMEGHILEKAQIVGLYKRR